MVIFCEAREVSPQSPLPSSPRSPPAENLKKKRRRRKTVRDLRRLEQALGVDLGGPQRRGRVGGKEGVARAFFRSISTTIFAIKIGFIKAVFNSKRPRQTLACAKDGPAPLLQVVDGPPANVR